MRETIMTMHGFRIETIADHLDLIETIARWHWDEWGHADPGGSPASWTAGLRERARRGAIPTTYVALDGDDLLGSVTLVEHDMATHPEWSPWLAGTYVTPAQRGQGVARGLVQHAVREAASMGVRRLYLYTESARGLYVRLGWSPLAEEEYEGQLVTVMAIEPVGEGS
ncbi:MAG TPA: GNAT family N-acetyltransferase [Thermomicrobiales bacterium]|nr:GNAT family N-acetyltransferase [Thermomicrobiales bacterium]